MPFATLDRLVYKIKWPPNGFVIEKSYFLLSRVVNSRGERVRVAGRNVTFQSDGKYSLPSLPKIIERKCLHCIVLPTLKYTRQIYIIQYTIILRSADFIT